MSSDPFGKVSAGDRLVIHAEAHNAFIDAALAEKNRRQSLLSGDVRLPRAEGSYVKVRNDTGEDIKARRGVVGLDKPLITPEMGEEAFLREIVFSAVVPESHHADSFAILLEPLRKDRMALAMTAGHVAVPVNMNHENHEYAWPPVDGHEPMESAASGPIRILWREEGSGTRQAIVGFPVECGTPLRVTNETGEKLEDGYACMIDSAGDNPWACSVKKPDGDSLLHIIPYAGPGLEAGDSAIVYMGDVMRFAIDDADGVEPGSFVGCVDDSFKLKKNRFGFLVLFTETLGANDYAYVRYSGLPPVVKAVEDAGEDDTIDVKHCDSEGDTEGETFTLDIIPEDEEEDA